MKLKLDANRLVPMTLMAILALSSSTALAQYEPLTGDCQEDRTACVRSCGIDRIVDDLRGAGGDDSDVQRAREEERWCRSKCDSDFNACVGRRPEPRADQ